MVAACSVKIIELYVVGWVRGSNYFEKWWKNCAARGRAAAAGLHLEGLDLFLIGIFHGIFSPPTTGRRNLHVNGAVHVGTTDGKW